MISGLSSLVYSFTHQPGHPLLSQHSFLQPWGIPMAKNIILCSDGTGNSGGKGNGTNVWRVFTSLELQEGKDPSQNEPEQVAFYDDGVGTESLRILRLFGGAFGWGLKRNVKQLYTHLVKNYSPGDHIYMFGFSRGAFTIRTLAAMVTACGILDYAKFPDESALQEAIDECYTSYRTGYKAWLSSPWFSLEEVLGKRRKDMNEIRQSQGVVCTHEDFDVQDYTHIPEELWSVLSEERRIPIRFVGLWDTVDAVGFPVAGVADFWNKCIFCFKFPNYTISQWINKVCHALAVDDERKTFHPLMVSEKGEPEDRIEQVWFAGMHSNVGGGYPKQGLAHISLNWMNAKADKAGLRFNDHRKKKMIAAINGNDRMYNSRSGLGIYYRYAPREIDKLCRENGIANPVVHVSVYERIARATDGYAPVSLPADAEILGSDSNYAGQNPAKLAALARDIQHAMANARDMYDKNSTLVTARKLIHTAFFCFFVLLVGIGVYLKATSDRTFSEEGLLLTPLKIITGLIPVVGKLLFDWVIAPIFQYFWLGIATLLLLLVFYFAGLFLKNRQTNLFSTFWKKVLPQIWW